jgi:outer membrane protein TolC
MKPTYIIVLLLLMLSIPVASTAQRDITLAEAIGLGLANNYGIRIESSNVEIAKKQNNWQYAGAYPSLSFGFGFNNSLNQRNDKYLETAQVQPSMRLNWILFNGFAVRIQKGRFGILEDLSEGNSVLVIENTIQAIILGYYKIVLEKERLKVMKEVMDLSKDRYDYVQNRKDLGAGTTYELLQAKNAWLTDKSNYLNQQMIYRSAMRELGYLLGQKDVNEYSPADTLAPVLNSYTLADLKNKMESNNTTLKNQYLNLALLEKNIDYEKSARFPALTFSGGSNYNYYPEKMNDSYDNLQALNKTFSFYANFALSFNIYNGNRVHTNIKIAEIEKQVGDIRLDDMKHQLNNRLLNMYDLFEVRKELAIVAHENLETSKLNLEISTEKYKNGVINSFNFRDVQRTYLTTALYELSALYQLIASHIDLVRLTGGIITEYDNGQSNR